MSDYWWIDYALLIVGAVIWIFVEGYRGKKP